MKKTVLIVMALALSISLAACGVKPGSVEPPEGAESGEFPRTYPDLANDPPTGAS